MISEVAYREGQGKRKAGISYLVVFLFALFCFCLFPATIWAGELTGPEQIILTWTGNPATSQTVTWLTPDAESDKLQYAESSGFDGDFSTAGQITATSEQFAGSDNYRYTVTITELNPGTQYVYRVGRDGAWSEALSFSTSADPDDFTFLYLGDIQDGYAQWGSMVEQIYEENPEIKFALLGGDLTDNGSDCNEWGEFLDAASDVFSRIPVMPAKGNHDGDLFVEFFALPDNGSGGASGEFYSFDYGDAHFVVLDTSNIITDSVKQWLQEDLQNTDKKWKFAVFHHPPYQNFDDNKTIDDALRENWVPTLEQNQVDMVFVGHQHVYMRTHPIFQGEVQSDSYGIVYVMGNSGSKHYSLGEGFPYIAREESGSNYQVIEIQGNLLTLTARKADGELIETYTIEKEDTPVEEEEPRYTVIPDETDPTYTPGSTEDGICTLTVNPGISGFNYLRVGITPRVSHSGEETVVFIHLRDNDQLGLNATRTDFDQVGTAQAGFNVKAGDVIKVYIVDTLTNTEDHNPVILQ
jgi:Icc-related predicted phosphoesterase